MRISVDRFMDCNRELEEDSDDTPTRSAKFSSPHYEEAREMFGLSFGEITDFTEAVNRLGEKYDW